MHDTRHGFAHDEKFARRSAAHAAFAAFMRAMHSHRQLVLMKLRERGTPPAQAFCMRALASNEGITQRDLAEMMHIARPTLTVMVQKMERAELVRRQVDEEDQRFTRIYLTEKGRSMQDEAHEALEDMIASAFGAMSEEDQRELTRLLGELDLNMQRTLGGLRGEPRSDD